MEYNYNKYLIGATKRRKYTKQILFRCHVLFFVVPLLYTGVINTQGTISLLCISKPINKDRREKGKMKILYLILFQSQSTQDQT